jgi:hypothetical protein
MIVEAFDRHFAANDPEKGGSYYLQCKVYHSREALLAELPDHEHDDDSDEEDAGPPKELEGGANAKDKNNR